MHSLTAVFSTSDVKGEIICYQQTPKKVKISAKFTAIPPGLHGFHIHRAGDLRGEGCKLACDHFHKGPPSVHGGPPSSHKTKSQRHTGDLGNIFPEKLHYTYILQGVSLVDLIGRSFIVHADPDDLGKGNQPDSKTTGHSGARIACAVIGRSEHCQDIPVSSTSYTRKRR